MDSENKEPQENPFPPFRGEPTAVDTEKCPNCGDNLEFDPEKGCLKCPSCGTLKEIETRAGQEIAFSELSKPNGGWQNQTHVYHCANCNAEEVLDKREIAHVCPFCGSPSVVEREEIDTLRPNALLPFLLDLPKASAAAIRWAKSGCSPRAISRRISGPKNCTASTFPRSRSTRTPIRHTREDWANITTSTCVPTEKPYANSAPVISISREPISSFSTTWR